MHGVPSGRAPAGCLRPVAASYLHAGNRFRKLGSFVKIDAARGVQAPDPRATDTEFEGSMTSSTTGEVAGRSHGWSPELLTLLGAMLAIGVGLAGLMFSFQGQVREDIRAVETRLREDMGTMETRLRGEMKAMETRLREEMQAMEVRIIRDLDRREARIREDMRTGETRIREDVRELRGDVGELRERVSHIEGRFGPQDTPAPRPGAVPGATPGATSSS